MGRHVCPSCQQRSLFRWTAASWARQFAMVGVGAIPVGLLFHLCFGGGWWIVGVALGGLIVGIPLDKFYDGKRRKLEKDEARDVS